MKHSIVGFQGFEISDTQHVQDTSRVHMFLSMEMQIIMPHIRKALINLIVPITDDIC